MRINEFAHTLLLACLWQAANAQTVDPFYSGSYSITNLGSVTGVPPKYGGMVFKDANTLWISGQATSVAGRYYSVPVTRGTDNHIVSLGSGTVLGFGNFSDGGIAFGPGGVLFYTEYPGNSIGEVRPPNYAADFKTVALTPLGVGASVGALNFVPAGFNGAGQFKVVSLDSNGFYTIPLTPDGIGGYDLGNATLETTLNTCASACGAEGFVYVPLGSPLFTNHPSGNGPLALSLIFPQQVGAPVLNSVVNQNISPNASLIVATPPAPPTPSTQVQVRLGATGIDGC